MSSNQFHEPGTITVEQRQELWRKLEKLRFAMVTTHDEQGAMTARPLTTQQIEDDGTAWFFIPLDGPIAEELARDPSVLVVYSDVGDNFYAALRGTARVIKDAAKIRELWSPLVGAWFPQGADDPNLGLLCVDIDKGEYWDPGSSKLVQFFAMAKAAATRTPPRNIGEHREFRT